MYSSQNTTVRTKTLTSKSHCSAKAWWATSIRMTLLCRRFPPWRASHSTSLWTCLRCSNNNKPFSSSKPRAKLSMVATSEVLAVSKGIRPNSRIWVGTNLITLLVTPSSQANIAKCTTSRRRWARTFSTRGCSTPNRKPKSWITRRGWNRCSGSVNGTSIVRSKTPMLIVR